MMKTCTKCGVEKELSGFHRDKTRRDGRFPHCKVCAIAHVSKWQKLNPGKRAPVKAKWQKENPQSGKDASAKWYGLHHAEYYEENRKALNEWQRTWKHDHPAEVNASTAHRRAAKRNATPIWADYDLIDATYTMAAAMTRLTGVEHHVDHIVPLRHPLVQGLHVGCNLQILPAVDNVKKGNRHWPDMPQAVQHI